MQFKYNYFGFVEPAHIYLCKTDDSIICELNGIDLSSVNYNPQINNFDTLKFDIHKYINAEESDGYELLDEAMYLRVDNIGYFRMSYPEVQNDGFDEYSSITALSCDCELSKKSLVGFKINCGSTDSMEYFAKNNVYETGESVKIAKDFITLYDESRQDLSLLHLVLEKIPGWSIGHVDETVMITTDEDGNKIPVRRSFDVDTKSVYAFLTQDVAKKYECIFVFDIFRRQINVYDVNTYGKDSGVFITYRNLIQTLGIAPVTEDNIFTRFNVRGNDDLTIDSVNFGTSTIEDLSYYLNTNHISQSLKDKYNKWLDLVKKNRKTYISLNKQYSTLMEQRDEINLRVPNDGLGTNWKQFSVEELQNAIIPKYTGYMNALKDKNLGYWNGTKWLNRGAEQDYKSYEGIIEIIKATIEYKNSSPANYNEKSNDLDDEIDAWKTKWELYGLTELQNKFKSYNENLETLKVYATAWEDLTAEAQSKMQTESHLTEQSYTISHNQYVKYKKWHDDCEKAIATRQKEYDTVQSQMDNILSQMSDLAKTVDKKEFGFSEEELKTLNKLYDDTDYSNENILTISTDTAEQIVNTQYELLDDALTELSKVCQPQLSFTLTMDNIFAMPEFREWQGNFDIGNFIYLSYDRNEQSFLKLRISSLTFNPCVIDGDFQVEFTNMLNYKGGRNDVSVLLDETVSTARNQISGKVKETLDTSGIQVSDALIKALINTKSFSEAISSGVFDTISANKGTFDQVIAKTINVQKIMADSGLFETIDAGNGIIRNVLAVEVNASRMSVGTLAVDRLILRGENSIMYELNKFGDITETKIPDGELDKYYLNGKHLQVNTLAADRIIANSINVEQITTDNLRGVRGWINLNKGTFLFCNAFTKGDGKSDSEMVSVNQNDWKNSTNGLSWDGAKFLIKGDVVANSLTLGSGVTIDTGNISGLQNYVTTDNLSNKLKDYTTTVDMKKEGLAFIVSENGSIGTYDSTKPLPSDTKGFFRVNTDGLMVAQNAVIYGTIYAQSGKFTGDVEARSLTLGSGVTISTDKIPGLSDYAKSSDLNAYVKTADLGPYAKTESLKVYFEKDKTYGVIENGKDGIKVSTNGLLEASNAIIYGTIYASSGWFKGELKAATGSFSGNVTATSLTLGNGVTISTDKISGLDKYAKTSDLSSYVKTVDLGSYAKTESLSVYFEKDKTYGVVQDGKDGIKVSTNGLLEASNAIIYGTIYASAGWFKGDVTANSLIASTSGNIAGWTINKDALIKGDGWNVNGDNAYLGKNGISISDNFVVNSNGTLRANNVNISGSYVSELDGVRITLKDGALRIHKNVDGILIRKAFIGINTFDNVKVEISDDNGNIITELSEYGFDGNVKNYKAQYKLPVTTSGSGNYYTTTIRTLKSDGVKRLQVYGAYGDPNDKDTEYEETYTYFMDQDEVLKQIKNLQSQIDELKSKIT